MKKFLNCTLVTLCYWVLLFIGPAIVLLWNNLSYSLTGGGYGQDSLMYKVLVFFSQPISCFLAAGMSGNIDNGKHKVCLLVNCVIGACYCAASFLMYSFFISNASMQWVMAVSAIACIVTAASQAKGLVSAVELRDLENLKNENAKLHSKIEEMHNTYRVSAKHLFLLDLMCNKSGVTKEKILESLYVSYLKASGTTEEEARADLQQKLNEENHSSIV